MSADGHRPASCDSDPVHLISAIQPHGALLALDRKTGCVSHASENIEAYLGHGPTALLGQTLDGILGEAELHPLPCGA